MVGTFILCLLFCPFSVLSEMIKKNKTKKVISQNIQNKMEKNAQIYTKEQRSADKLEQP